MKRLTYMWLALAAAQTAAAGQDLQLWSEAGVSIKLAKKWQTKFNGQLRLDKNISAVDSFMPELAVAYRPAKFLRLEAGYRYIAEPIESREETYIESWQRLFAEAQLRQRLRPVTFKYRLRLEEEFGWPWDENEKFTAKHTVRNLLGVEVGLPASFAPFLSGELFLRISDPDGTWHKWRLTAGLDYRFGRHTVSLFYRLEDMLDDPQDPTRHIIGTGYYYRF